MMIQIVSNQTGTLLPDRHGHDVLRSGGNKKEMESDDNKRIKRRINEYGRGEKKPVEPGRVAGLKLLLWSIISKAFLQRHLAKKWIRPSCLSKHLTTIIFLWNVEIFPKSTDFSGRLNLWRPGFQVDYSFCAGCIMTKDLKIR